MCQHGGPPWREDCLWTQWHRMECRLHTLRQHHVVGPSLADQLTAYECTVDVPATRHIRVISTHKSAVAPSSLSDCHTHLAVVVEVINADSGVYRVPASAYTSPASQPAHGGVEAQGVGC